MGVGTTSILIVYPLDIRIATVYTMAMQGTYTSTSDQKRQDQARFIVQGARVWIKIWTKDGRPLAYGIESATRPNRFHLADSRRCTCEDFQRGHWCYHSRAVRLWVRQVAAERKAAAALTPTREDVVIWDRAARVRAYDRCFGEAA